MASFDRYAIYFSPEQALAEAGAAWLGWDMVAGLHRPHPELTGIDLSTITERPRKYGLHATIKPPFVLAHGASFADLRNATCSLCTTFAPVILTGLKVSALGPFLALTIAGKQEAAAALAGEAVRRLDAFRAPLSEDALARRRQARLTPAQDQHLRDWGYPYVLDEFQFHITLTGRLSRADEKTARVAAETYFEPLLPKPFIIGSLSLAGQKSDGMFYEIERFSL